jgi:hypothetical protein
MTEHVSSALLIYSGEGQKNVRDVLQNPHGTTVTPMSFDDLQGNEAEVLHNIDHAVVSAPLSVLKKVIFLAMKYNFSLGFVPLASQFSLIRSYALPKDTSEAISFALRNDSKEIDIVYCKIQCKELMN